MSLLYVGDVGATVIIQLLVTNIPAGTDIRVFVENPSGLIAEWVLEGGELNKTTGVITHLTKSGELPYEGEYRVQCREVSTSPAVDIGTSIDSFTVYRRISIATPKTLSAIFDILTG